MVDVSVLYKIQARDPDSGNTEPTARQMRRFKAWAVRHFGLRAWDAYNGQPWANVPE